jgi:argininosuccinate lyase
MAEPTHPLVEAFTTSFPFDRRLYPYDIDGSIAHAEMLGRQRIIPLAEARRIVRGLKAIRNELDSGSFVAHPGDEDIHMAVERRLIERIGAVGGKLHTARSRNDQVALDVRLFLRAETDRIQDLVLAVQRSLAGLARQYRDLAMPGYTHLQPAQPVLFAHHLLAYVHMLQRDRQRLAEQRARIDVMPLGSGALAGTTFPIDRAWVARKLGFARISDNSMDAVSDRDFIVEFLATAALLGVHLSRFAEDLILWSSPHIGFVELPDAFATGSSIMPQKKNPDVAELIRGKTGRLLGNLVAMLTVLKALPMTYNRDLQEDKEPLFDSVDTIRGSLAVLAAMIPALRIDRQRTSAAATIGYTLATELADYLTTRGAPFREAHGIVGAIVRHCAERGLGLQDLGLDDLRRFSPRFERDVLRWLTPEAAIRRRRVAGGTAPGNIDRQLRALRL